MATADLFAQMNLLFRNQTPPDPVQVFVLHRFLASEQVFAPVAKELAQIWDDGMVVEIWRSCLPRSSKAPYLKYSAPKRSAAPPELIKKIADTEGWTFAEADESVLLMEKMIGRAEIAHYYGIEEKSK